MAQSPRGEPQGRRRLAQRGGPLLAEGGREPLRHGREERRSSCPPVRRRPGRACSMLVAGKVTVTIDRETQATLEGHPVTRAELRPDNSGSPDVSPWDALTLVGDRAGRAASASGSRTARARSARPSPACTGTTCKDDYRITARYVAYPEPRPIKVPNILGQTESMPSPGYAVFERDGQEIRLEGVFEEKDAEQLFFIVRDQTSRQGDLPGGPLLLRRPAEGRDASSSTSTRPTTRPAPSPPYATCPVTAAPELDAHPGRGRRARLRLARGVRGREVAANLAENTRKYW